MEVMSMVEVGRILHGLGLITIHDAYRLGQASTTIILVDGFDTVPMTTVANIVGVVHP
jgi:hypothetical protein